MLTRSMGNVFGVFSFLCAHYAPEIPYPVNIADICVNKSINVNSFVVHYDSSTTPSVNLITQPLEVAV